LSGSKRDAAAVVALLTEGAERELHGGHAEALAAFERAIDMAPAHPQAHFLAGRANLRIGRGAKGVAHMRVAVAAAPDNAVAWWNLALGLRSLGRIAEGREAARRALALDARLADAWSTLGLIEQDDGRIEDARAHFERALAIDPRLASARVNLANCDWLEGRIDAALEGYREAARLDPALAEVPYNIGNLHHRSTGDFEQAIARYREAIALRADYALPHHNLALALFLTGRFGEAWRELRWRPMRLEHEAMRRAAGSSYEIAEDAPLTGTRWLVLAEQGLGDVLFFLRFAPLVRARGATLDFSGDPRLHAMLARTGLFERLAADPDEARVTGAREILAGDLPWLLADAEREATPAPLTLAPEPDHVTAMRGRLGTLGPPPYAALAWRSGIARTGAEERLFKEAPIAELGTALRGARMTWISIQREPRAGETEALSAAIGAPVHDLARVNEDLEDALALMSVADHYIGVSSTNIHLRAGAGGCAHVLVPFPPDWRWMARGDSPWFPRMRVYRQPASRDWTSTLRELAADLSRLSLPSA
jgi:tetratricopeptide (TPR) repeat protein